MGAFAKEALDPNKVAFRRRRDSVSPDVALQLAGVGRHPREVRERLE
jgi:hypothetical protein